jgi:glycosyltransferase involved in cell wall biosynthesis
MEEHLRDNAIGRVALVPPPIARLPPGSTSPERRVVFAGRVTTQKGIHVLIEAMRKVDAVLDVCGEGWALPTAQRLTRRWDMTDRVCFHGWLDEAEIRERMTRATVVAVPSLWPEPFGLVGIEAMAVGRPVVGTSTGAIPEWLDHGRTGMLVSTGNAEELADALRQMVADPDRAAEMGAAGRDRVSRDFTEAAHVAALESAYIAAGDYHDRRISARRY